MQQKQEIVQDLKEELEIEKARYKGLKQEVKRLEKRAEQLQLLLKQKEEELEQLEEILRDRDNLIEDLERQLNEKQNDSTAQKKPADNQFKRPQSLGWYRPIKGDLIDELIAKHFNSLRKPMPIKRLGDGNYIFGTRKIYVKLISGRLVVRVGGGFMSIEEFLNQYAEMEMSKVQLMIDNGTFNFDDFVD